MEVTTMILSMFPTLLFTAAWIVVVVFAVKMVKSGDKPEKFLLIGACLMLASSLLAVAAAGLNPWIVPKLVEAFFLETYRKCFYLGVGHLAHQGRDRTRIHSSAEEDSQRHIADQAFFNRILQVVVDSIQI